MIIPDYNLMALCGVMRYVVADNKYCCYLSAWSPEKLLPLAFSLAIKPMRAAFPCKEGSILDIGVYSLLFSRSKS